MMRRQPPRSQPGVTVRPLSRHPRLVRCERDADEEPVALPVLSDPRTRLDRPLYCLLDAAGALCAGQVWQGECVLLFTSPAAAATFARSAGFEVRPPQVFSRGRSEFLKQARGSFRQGFIGGLIDPTTRTGEIAFLGFDVDRRQGRP